MKLTACTVDLSRGVVQRDGRLVRLTPLEARLLTYLAANPTRVIPRGELLREVWEYSAAVRTRADAATVLRLRGKLEADPSAPDHLLTVHGVGYRFEPPAAPVRPRRIPHPASPIIGRDDALGRVAGWLEAARPVVTLTGPPGVGKTRLALEVLSRTAGEVRFCDLSHATDERDVAGVVAARLGLRPDAEPARAVGYALGALDDAVLLLDNAEQVADVLASLLERWRADAPAVRWLVTSRRSLGLAEEQLLVVRPLDVDAPDDDMGPAVALFVARARQLRPDFAPSAAELDDVRAVVRRLDGLPLAIELAAARARVLAPRDMLARREDLLDLLQGRRGAVRAALDSSWALLSPWQQRALATCGVFRGGFSVDAAAAVIDLSPWPEARCSIDVVTVLVDHSFLQVQPADRHGLRLGMLQVTAAWVAERFAALDESVREAAVRAHVAWFAGNRVQSGDLPNVRTAVRRALDRDDGERAARACLSGIELWSSLGPLAEGVEGASGVLATHAVTGELRARLLLGRARLEQRCGDVDHARRSCDAALVAAEGEAELAASVLAMSAGLDRTRGQQDAAVAQLERGLALIDGAPGVDRLRARLLRQLAHLHLERGDTAPAAELYERAHADFLRAGATTDAYRVLDSLARVRRIEGDVAASRALQLESLAGHRAAGNRMGEGVSMAGLAVAQYFDGDLEGAAATLEQAFALHAAIGDRVAQGVNLGIQGNVALAAGRPDQAKRLQGRAARILQAAGDPRRSLIARANLEDVRLVLGEPGVLESLNEVAELCRAMGLAAPEGVVRGSLGLALARAGEHPAATEAFAQGAQLLRGMGYRLELGKLLAKAAEAALLADDPARARAAFDEATALREAMAGAGPELHRTLDALAPRIP